MRRDQPAEAGDPAELTRWHALTGRLSPARLVAAHDAVYADLAGRLAEPHRHYHTLDHVLEVLDVLDSLGAHDETRLAAWFHDAIYDPRAPAGTNEAASASLARAALASIGLAGATIDEVARLIELTANHSPAAGDVNGADLSDADLGVLGATRTRYDQYARDVRAEYAWLSDEDWRRGRAALLQGLLERERLFHSAALHRERDAQARRNLRRELAALAEPGGA